MYELDKFIKGTSKLFVADRSHADLGGAPVCTVSNACRVHVWRHPASTTTFPRSVSGRVVLDAGRIRASSVVYRGADQKPTTSSGARPCPCKTSIRTCSVKHHAHGVAHPQQSIMHMAAVQGESFTGRVPRVESFPVGPDAPSTAGLVRLHGRRSSAALLEELVRSVALASIASSSRPSSSSSSLNSMIDSSSLRFP